jgi:hypothetical protein
MVEALKDIHVVDGDPVTEGYIPAAVTAQGLVYDDGSTQVFESGGATTYVEQGRPTQGKWYIDDDGRFCSFWPPSYRACYDLHWIVEEGRIVGVRFTELNRGSSFDGRYR